MDLPRVRMPNFSIVLRKQRLVQGEREVRDGRRHNRRNRVEDSSWMMCHCRVDERAAHQGRVYRR